MSPTMLPASSWSTRSMMALFLAAGTCTFSFLYMYKLLQSPGKEAAEGETSTPTMSPAEVIARMRGVYEKIDHGFSSNGLNVATVSSFRQYFGGLKEKDAAVGWGAPWPLKYVNLPNPVGPLAFPTVRLLVIPLEDSPKLVAMASAATRALISALPRGEYFLNSPRNYHITLFHTSGLFEPVTNPINSDGGVNPDDPPFQRKRSSDVVLAREMQILEVLSSQTQVPTLEVDRVVLADSGVLLLLLVERNGIVVEEIRRKGRGLLPGMPSKQPNIIHVSLMRYLSPIQMSQDEKDTVLSACRLWTQKMKGTLFHPRKLWFVYEEEFSTIVGQRHSMPLRQ